MKKTLLFLIVLFVSVYAIGQKSMAVSAGQSNIGTAATLLDNISIPGVSHSPMTPDYMALWVLPATGSTGTSANSRCPSNIWLYQRTMYLITPAEMIASGFPTAVNSDVNSIGWQLASAGDTARTGELKIYLMNTADVTFTLGTTWTTTGFTMVASIPSWTTPITVGDFTVPFSGGSTFSWTGGGVYVAWEFANAGGPVLNTTGATAAMCNVNLTNGLVGNRSNVAPPTTLAASSYRPITAFGNNYWTDMVAVTNIYTLEKAPMPYGVPTPINVRVANTFTAPVTFDVVVTVEDALTHTNRFTSAPVTVTALAAGTAQLLNFTWTPAIAEDVIIKATATSPSGETVIANNVLSIPGNVNNNTFSYIYNMVGLSGAVGWTAPYAFVFAAKYTMHGAGLVNSVNVAIGNSTTCTDKVVTAVVLNKQGQYIGTSADHTILLAEEGTIVNFPILVPPSVGPEEFYVGLATTTATATYYPMAYGGEVPLRENAYYQFDIGGSTPTAMTGYKMGLEAVVAPFTGVVYPRDFTATTAAATQINLSWIQNVNTNPVMVVYSTTNTFGAPVDGTPYAVNSFLPGGGKVIYNASGTSFSHTGLVLSTIYYYQAYSVDAANHYSRVVTSSAPTYYGVPYPQNFEVTTQLPIGWSGTMSVSPLHGTSGSKGMYFDMWGTSGPDYMNFTAVSPFVVTTANPCRLAFAYRLTDWVSGVYPGPGKVLGAGDKVEVQVSTTGAAPWTTIYTIDQTTHVTSQDFVTLRIPLTGYSSSSLKVRFYGTWATGDWLTDIDDFIVEETPACSSPSSLAASSITTTSASLGWNAGTGTVWELQYGLFGFPLGSGTIVTTGVTNPYPLGGLTANTQYSFYVRTNCSGTFSEWAGPSSFTTLCAVAAAPFNEGFELTAFAPSCWSIGGTAPWVRSTDCSGYGTGTASALANFYNYTAGAVMNLMTFEFNTTGLSSPKLKFDYAYATYSGEPDELDVYYSTDGGLSYLLLEAMPGGTSGILNTGGTVAPGEFVPTAAQWATHSIVLPAGTNKIKFAGISGYGNDLYIDNVKVEAGLPVNRTVTGTLISPENNCYDASNIITVGPLAVNSGASANFIAGVSIDFITGTTVSAGGYLWGRISTGTYCGGKAPMLPAAPEPVAQTQPSLEQAFFTIYPNPTNGNFTIAQKGHVQYSNINIEVYSMHGEKVITEQMIGAKSHEVGTSSLPSGLYFVKVIANGYTETIKLVKTR